MQKSFKHPRPENVEGFALIVSLAMITLAAVITVTLLASASSERFNANAYSKRARAEMAAESGLAAALNALVGVDNSDTTKTIPNDFRYVTAVGDGSNPALIPYNYDTTSGSVTLNSPATRLLYSQSGTVAKITLSTPGNPKIIRQVGYLPITSTNPSGAAQEVERYAFYIDEGGNRQNLGVQGGSPRLYARDPNELPLTTATAAPAPFTDPQIQLIKNNRPLLFTPETANPIMLANAVTPTIDNYSYSTASAVTDLTPEGKPRVNLTKLKAYVDTLAVDQTSGNPRAGLVNRLLDPNEKGAEWSSDGKSIGGNLSFLTKLGHYSSAQCHQIVANLLDYLDADIFPTTDDINSPTYFGVEGQADNSGAVVGHPYINFIGTGLIFNRSGASGNTGGLNSTRILVVLGLVNPWSKSTKNWPTFYIEPEIDILINGTASGGTLGGNASDYFLATFSSSNADPASTGNPEKGYPIAEIPPNTGYIFPSPMSSVTSYSTFKDLKGTRPNGLGQPPGMVFSNLAFQFRKLRLKYTSTDGKTGYVQVLDHLAVQTAVPSTVSVGTTNSPPSLIYKFAGGNPADPDKTDYHLNGDPRLNFLANSWILSKSTEKNPAPPTPSTAVAIFSGSDNNNWDFTGKPPTITDHLWYTTTDVTANFYVKSPPSDGSAPTLDSAGELGFVHTGIPWETLRFYVAGGEVNGKERDKELLAYIKSGTFAAADYGTVPTHAGQKTPANPTPLIGGPLNVNNTKTPTLQSLFLGASAVSDSDAKDFASGNKADPNVTALTTAIVQNTNDALTGNGTAKLSILPGDYLGDSGVKTVTSSTTADFDREVLARRTANVTATQSTRFTVYALGEARDKAGAANITTSTVNLRAEVEMQSDSQGRPMPRVLSTTYYLTN